VLAIPIITIKDLMFKIHTRFFQAVFSFSKRIPLREGKSCSRSYGSTTIPRSC